VQEMFHDKPLKYKRREL